MTGVVLVHGLWSEPRHFDLVAEDLRAEGVEVAVPELHRGSLEADTAVVQAEVDAMGPPPIVVGHSYGGSVITGLTGAAHLVYLAAYAPDEGESAASLGSSEELAAAITRVDRGVTALDPAKAVAALYQDCPPDLVQRAVDLLRPQVMACPKGSPVRQAWREVPSTYVVCDQDRTVDPDLQRRMAQRCDTELTWPSGHCPFLSRPDLVLELIEELSAFED
ncbi:alpha/beta fold hydrolase [Allosaccharopolyspora coralli]|uniref:Alpha/beta fold hydrolase n=1 Tax=Allosaccharopolyspora coralli TaxID=2665642 RepID=A0A5Q3Q8B3_9PSEU|nr:alpha/beta hydrolase [Allosaccharopolyspora coralli]QGK70613.1 alpha/beta fold hydrolase [Allosaccharopolyspora coralli]